MKWSGNRPALTAEQAAELKQLVELRRSNPKAYRHLSDAFLKARYGLRGNSLYRYARGEIKRYG